MTAAPFQRALDALVRPRIRLAGRGRSAFRVCGFAGLFAAVLVAAVLVRHQGLPLALVAAIAAVGCGTFVALAMAMKILTGEETLVYYHHEIAILLNTGIAMWLLGQPVLPLLDATILGVGAFLAFGRVGCLMVGCCHGRPHPWGVGYGGEHAAAGFPPLLVGVRLFPIQLVEAVWVAATVAVGAAMVLRGAPAGAAFAWYVVAYDLGRFLFEFARGDAARPYHAGFSQAQWLALILTIGVGGAELFGLLPLTVWHVAAGPAIGAGMVAVAAHRRRDAAGRFRLLHPAHLRELAEAMGVGEEEGGVRVGRTSLGIRVSTASTAGVRHQTLSRDGAPLRAEEGRVLAHATARLGRVEGRVVVIPGAAGVYHVVAGEGVASPAPAV